MKWHSIKEEGMPKGQINGCGVFVCNDGAYYALVMLNDDGSGFIDYYTMTTYPINERVCWFPIGEIMTSADMIRVEDKVSFEEWFDVPYWR